MSKKNTSDAPSALDLPPIVSSYHLASSEGWQLSELEYGLFIAFNAFSRWMTRCMSASGIGDLGPLDIMVLHNVNHRDRPKRIADICFMLNIEDQHTVNYSLKKLLKGGLVESEKRGKEVFYRTTKTGYEACDDYRKVREQCLLSSLKVIDTDTDDLRVAATILRSVSGLYDQAARAAASL
ncbi:transcriptional regulator [Hahella sp. CCB-MM4]|uniref:winged helix DNA-binding protein n=1 Tax=Hahella sp. (strain CCB-MM4) TaxID=1926491 RepID=UPI000B9A3287|nr:winged helix DNA-binding protein [Hahella sp. CCB-MM4]OZG71898.1 transcriptional regulator [Hahella sp. CCB-MM4]